MIQTNRHTHFHWSLQTQAHIYVLSFITGQMAIVHFSGTSERFLLFYYFDLILF